MARNPYSTFDLHRSARRYRVNAAGVPGCSPLQDRAPAHADQSPELLTRPRSANCIIDWIHVHAGKCGTISSACQATDSSSRLGHARSMDIKIDFARRLHEALDTLHVDAHLAERKRFVARILDVTDRQVANYFLGQKLPSMENLAILAAKLGVSLDWLMTGRGPMRPLTDAEIAHIESTRSLTPEDQAKVYRLGEVFRPQDDCPHTSNVA